MTHRFRSPRPGHHNWGQLIITTGANSSASRHPRRRQHWSGKCTSVWALQLRPIIWGARRYMLCSELVDESCARPVLSSCGRMMLDQLDPEVVWAPLCVCTVSCPSFRKIACLCSRALGTGCHRQLHHAYKPLLFRAECNSKWRKVDHLTLCSILPPTSACDTWYSTLSDRTARLTDNSPRYGDHMCCASRHYASLPQPSHATSWLMPF